MTNEPGLLHVTHDYRVSDEMHARLWSLAMQLDAISVQLAEARLDPPERKENHRGHRDPW
jgi:hypothetical protein